MKTMHNMRAGNSSNERQQKYQDHDMGARNNSDAWKATEWHLQGEECHIYDVSRVRLQQAPQQQAPALQICWITHPSVQPLSRGFTRPL
jgi:hypothetical protein